jgi:hypothetical protein
MITIPKETRPKSIVSRTLDKIVLLQENLSEPALATGIVLEIEFVKAMECVFVSMYIQQIHIEIISVDNCQRTE